MLSSTPSPPSIVLPFPHEKDKPLALLSTLGIGGPARYFTEVKSKEKLLEIIRFCLSVNLAYIIIGKGSNSLFDDRGFNGLVIANRIDGFKREENLITVGAGFSFARLGLLTARENLSGLEFAAGIPASVGGAIFMNAGANGQETQDTLIEVDYITETGELKVFKKEELTFGYRFSSFQNQRGAIVGARFLLKTSTDSKARQEALVSNRLKTQPYKDKSAGCAFRNPLEVPAGRLIESLGMKGFYLGGAAVSEMHANFIINQNNATSEDVRKLIDMIKQKVWKLAGIQLEVEIRFIPYELK